MLISFSWFCHLRAIYLHNTLGSSFGCYSLHPIPEQHFSVSLIRKRSDATSVDQNLVLSSLQFNSTASLIDGRTQNILDLQTEKGPSIQSKWTQWVAFYVATQKLEPINHFCYSEAVAMSEFKYLRTVIWLWQTGAWRFCEGKSKHF